MTFNRLSALLIEILLILIGAGLAFAARSTEIDVERFLTAASAFTLISFLIEIGLWRRISGEWFSPYTVFYLVLFLFCSGQCVGWCLGLDMERDLRYFGFPSIEIDNRLILNGLCFTCLGKSFFHLGAMFFYRDDLYLKNARRYKASEVLAAYRKLGTLMLFIAVPAFLARVTTLALAVKQGGYLAYYDTVQNSSYIMRAVGRVGDFYLPSLLILLIGYRDSLIIRRIILSLMILDAAIDLFIGGRSGAVMGALAICLTYRYFIGTFTKKQILIGGVGGYGLLALLNSVALTRGQAERSLSDYFSNYWDSFENVFGTIIGEIGWSLSSICLTMALTPSQYPFRYGMSYLVAPLTCIPSSFFFGEHPCVIWAELDNWITRVLNSSYGLGYTMVAEAYVNFGWLGLIVLMIEGAVLVRVFARVCQRYANQDILGATFQIIVIMIVMKALVRASMVPALRLVIFIVVPMYVLVRITLNSIRKERRGY